ncbi:MAG: DEAD/DEAH box helicase family protein [Alphaproteobacteria bacterium]|nr:DEAD/DEAH box helicase family protein [Alphaproteobacteria bacterium]OJV13175.1 MAG: hypothetical protein BGO27_00015 [Alphaproteobacteria bacterium 33-17]
MVNHLSTTARDNIKNYGSSVYYGYLSMEFLNSEPKFKEFMKNPVTGIVNLFGENVQVTVNVVNGERKISFTSPNGAYAENVANIKPITQYTADEKLKILSSKDLVIEDDKGTNKIGVKLTDFYNETIKIGGEDKIDLYSMHIANLGEMLKNIDSDDSMLIALPTGSGKTYTQAVWMLVLYMSNVNSCFTVPGGSLVEQFCGKDLPRLLPKNVTDKIIRLPKTEAGQAPENPTLFTDMKKTDRPKIVVSSWNEILKNRIDDVMGTSQDLFVSFDEQHKAMYSGGFAAKIKELSKKFKCMFLTATPDKETFKICGNKALVKMSMKQKIEGGYAVPTEFETSKVKNTAAKKRDLKNARDKKRSIGKKIADFANDIYDSTCLAVYDSITPDVADPARALAEQMQEKVLYKKSTDANFYSIPDTSAMSDEQKTEVVDEYLRRNVVPVMQNRKTLVITDSHEDMVNTYLTFNDMLHNKNIQYMNKISNGKISQYNSRSDEIEQISKGLPLIGFLVRPVDSNVKKDWDTLHNNEMEDNLNKAVASLPEDLQVIAKAKIKTSLNIKSRKIMFNNSRKLIIDHIMCKLLKIDVVELDRLRNEDPAELSSKLENVCNKVGKQNLKQIAAWYTYHQEYNKSGIDAKGAESLAQITLDLIKIYIEGSKKGYRVDLAKCSWLDQDLYTKCGLSTKSAHGESEFGGDYVTVDLADMTTLDRFANQNIMMMHFGSFEGSDYKCDVNRSFNEMKERVINLKDPTQKATDARAQEFVGGDLDSLFQKEAGFTVYNPVYNNYSSVVKDNYMLHFGSIVISNQKTEGWNDQNLDNVFAIALDKSSAILNPSQLAQGMGRARGLKKHVKPYGMLFVNNMYKAKDALEFSPEDINSENMYEKYFKGREKYKINRLSNLARFSATNIRKSLDNNIDPFGNLNKAKYIEELHDDIINVARDIDSANNHNIRMTRQHLRGYIGQLKKELNTVQARLINPIDLKLVIKVLFNMANAIFGFLRLFYNIKSYLRIRKLLKAIDKVKKDPATTPEELKVIKKLEAHIKVLRKLNLSLLVEPDELLEITPFFLANDKVMKFAGVLSNPSSLIAILSSDSFKNKINQLIGDGISKIIAETTNNENKNTLKSFDYIGTLSVIIGNNSELFNEIVFRLMKSDKKLNNKFKDKSDIQLFTMFAAKLFEGFRDIFKVIAPNLKSVTILADDMKALTNGAFNKDLKLDIGSINGVFDIANVITEISVLSSDDEVMNYLAVKLLPKIIIVGATNHAAADLAQALKAIMSVKNNNPRDLSLQDRLRALFFKISGINAGELFNAYEHGNLALAGYLFSKLEGNNTAINGMFNIKNLITNIADSVMQETIVTLMQTKAFKNLLNSILKFDMEAVFKYSFEGVTKDDMLYALAASMNIDVAHMDADIKNNIKNAIDLNPKKASDSIKSLIRNFAKCKSVADIENIIQKQFGINFKDFQILNAAVATGNAVDVNNILKKIDISKYTNYLMIELAMHNLKEIMQDKTLFGREKIEKAVYGEIEKGRETSAAMSNLQDLLDKGYSHKESLVNALTGTQGEIAEGSFLFRKFKDVLANTKEVSTAVNKHKIIAISETQDLLSRMDSDLDWFRPRAWVKGGFRLIKDIGMYGARKLGFYKPILFNKQYSCYKTNKEFVKDLKAIKDLTYTANVAIPKDCLEDLAKKYCHRTLEERKKMRQEAKRAEAAAAVA